jgi:hypothetical protein
MVWTIDVWNFSTHWPKSAGFELNAGLRSSRPLQ